MVGLKLEGEKCQQEKHKGKQSYSSKPVDLL